MNGLMQDLNMDEYGWMKVMYVCVYNTYSVDIPRMMEEEDDNDHEQRGSSVVYKHACKGKGFLLAI